jgi:hypothetical protein
MNDVERFLDQACCGVGGSHELRQHLRKELHEHLTAEIEGSIEAGMDRQEAVQRAIEEFGDPVVVRDGLQNVHGRRLLTLLIEKSMIWKARTMKTGWKWSFVAHVALILVIAFEVFLITAPMMYFLPSIESLHRNLGIPMFAYLEFLADLLARFLYQYGWIPGVIASLAGWIIFERKCHSENKSTMRLAGLSLVSFIMFLVMAAVCVPITIDLAMLPGQIYDTQINLTPQQAERIVLPKISATDAAFKALGEAIDQEDWPALGKSAARLCDTCKSLHETSVSIMLLAGENQRDNLVDIRDLLDEIEKSSHKIYHRFGTYEYAEPETKDDTMRQIALAYFEELQKPYQELKKKSDLFAVHHDSDTAIDVKEE